MAGPFSFTSVKDGKSGPDPTHVSVCDAKLSALTPTIDNKTLAQTGPFAAVWFWYSKSKSGHLGKLFTKQYSNSRLWCIKPIGRGPERTVEGSLKRADRGILKKRINPASVRYTLIAKSKDFTFVPWGRRFRESCAQSV